MKRILLFLATNFSIILVINVVISVFGLTKYFHDIKLLLVVSVIVGFSGSFISLLLSKTIAIHSVNAQIITTPQNATEKWLLNTVANQANQWNLAMPQVAIYSSSVPNAFATGPTRNKSLIALSTGLLEGMTQDEVEAVLAHEMAHVGNGDMVTMTLIQGVINTFVFFAANKIAEIIASSQNNRALERGIHYLVSMVLQILFGFLASLIVLWFSRHREYRADACAARLVGAPKMIAALQRLKGDSSDLPEGLTAFGIASDSKDSLLATHPSLDNRIARLRGM
ncbi:protease HtpX [Snodgrassella sp. B3882]|nr:protease HtpX [Snodgrassella sp. B3882]MCX8744512.1 protease HtpX [Snodgrassella sp. B3882]